MIYNFSLFLKAELPQWVQKKRFKRKRVGVEKGSSGKRFEFTKYFLKFLVLNTIIKSNILHLKGLANEDEKNSVQINFFGKYLYFPLLELFSARTFFLTPFIENNHGYGKDGA